MPIIVPSGSDFDLLASHEGSGSRGSPRRGILRLGFDFIAGHKDSFEDEFPSSASCAGGSSIWSGPD